MSDTRFNLLHTFDHESKRDAYGFALRPQHAQRYREYAGIYKEEEDERVERWKIFLEHQKELAQPSLTEENDKEILKAEATESEEETVLEKISEESKLTTVSRGECQEKEAAAESTVSGTGSQGDKATDINNFKEETLSDGSKESNKSEATDHSVLEGGRAGEKAEATKLKEGSVSERPEEGNDSSRRSGSDGSAELDPQKVQLPKEAKSKKVRTWAQIRGSLRVVEDMMSSRVKKRKDMNSEQISKNEDHLQVNEIGSQEGDSMKDIKVKDDNTSHGSPNASHENSHRDGLSPKPYFPWKELECLVRGGVPKELRGEVWQAFVGVKARREDRYYQDLLAPDFNADETKEFDNVSTAFKKWKKQIEKDIPRTFPGHPALNQDGRDSLRRLLVAYARHNPSVGYCQAMNFFAGILLLLMPEENAFWTFVGIIDDYFEGYYTEQMIESQVDQLVFEELIRERFPKLVNHLDYLGVQVAWISGPWFLSIFVNILPWESVLRVWDVILYEGNRVMLFRTALALMELYGPALVTTKDAGDAITLLQSLTGSTFDSSQLVFTACMGYLAVTEAKLQELRKKHRPSVIEVVEERSKKGRVWKDSKGLASKLYSFKHDPETIVEENKNTEGSGDSDAVGDISQVKHPSSKLEEILGGSKVDSLPDLQERVDWMKVELFNLLEEKRSAVLRAEELETALVEMVKQDNRLELSARIEELERQVAELRQALADKKEQEQAMLQVLMRVEQEQKVTEDARRSAEQDAAAQRYVVHVLEEKYEKAVTSVAQMEKRVVMAESMLEATLQYQSGQAKAVSSPRSVPNQGPTTESPKRRIGLFGLGWRDKNKDKPTNTESSDSKSTHE